MPKEYFACLFLYSFSCISILPSSQKSLRCPEPLVPDDGDVSLTAVVITTSARMEGKGPVRRPTPLPSYLKRVGGRGTSVGEIECNL